MSKGFILWNTFFASFEPIHLVDFDFISENIELPVKQQEKNLWITKEYLSSWDRKRLYIYIHTLIASQTNTVAVQIGKAEVVEQLYDQQAHNVQSLQNTENPEQLCRCGIDSECFLCFE